MTNRREPHFDWFLQSLARQCIPSEQPVIIVDFYADEPGRKESVMAINPGFPITHVTPKPSLWQGKHKITQSECFDAGNARNTALCLARQMYIAWVDDLSVLQPTWYSSVHAATSRNAITLGTYRKVAKLDVKDGLIVSFQDFPRGHDPRVPHFKTNRPTQCDQRMLFGCSLLAPVETMLDLGGWPETLCAGTGYEDCVMAIVIRKHKIATFFDPMMQTIESEEGHKIDPPFNRWDPCTCTPCSNPRKDKSHAMLKVASGWEKVDNGYDMRSLRNSILSGGSFPIPVGPATEWFTGIPLQDLTFE